MSALTCSNLASNEQPLVSFLAPPLAMSAPAAVAARLCELREMKVEQKFKLNNTALKWIRDSHEQPPGYPTHERVDLTETDPLDIGVLVRDTGMEYSFAPNATQPWSWRQMLAALDPSCMAAIVGTEEQGGIVSVTCEPLWDAYDSKRHHAAKKAKPPRPYPKDAPVPVWDFVVTRLDGSAVRFHTSQTHNKVEIAAVTARPNYPTNDMAPPKGRGESTGRGCYTFYKKATYPLSSGADTSSAAAVAFASAAAVAATASSAAVAALPPRPQPPPPPPARRLPPPPPPPRRPPPSTTPPTESLAARAATGEAQQERPDGDNAHEQRAGNRWSRRHKLTQVTAVVVESRFQ